MKKLFNDNSDSDEETPILKTNKEYERVYNSFREKELKQKCKGTEPKSFYTLNLFIYDPFSKGQGSGRRNL